MSAETESCCCANEASECAEECCGGCACEEGNCHVGVAGWFAIGMVAAALGVYAAKELRNRYKFKRRTPYDFYSRTAKSDTDEFGMGI